jgi:hypothetical protein
VVDESPVVVTVWTERQAAAWLPSPRLETSLVLVLTRGREQPVRSSMTWGDDSRARVCSVVRGPVFARSLVWHPFPRPPGGASVAAVPRSSISLLVLGRSKESSSENVADRGAAICPLSD